MPGDLSFFFYVKFHNSEWIPFKSSKIISAYTGFVFWTEMCSIWHDQKSRGQTPFLFIQVTWKKWHLTRMSSFFQLSPRKGYVVRGASLLFWIVAVKETYPFSSMSNFITLNRFLLNLQKSFLLILVSWKKWHLTEMCSIWHDQKSRGQTPFLLIQVTWKKCHLTRMSSFFQLFPRKRFVVRGVSLLFWIVVVKETYPVSSMSIFITLNGFLLNL